MAVMNSGPPAYSGWQAVAGAGDAAVDAVARPLANEEVSPTASTATDASSAPPRHRLAPPIRPPLCLNIRCPPIEVRVDTITLPGDGVPLKLIQICIFITVDPNVKSRW